MSRLRPRVAPVLVAGALALLLAGCGEAATAPTGAPITGPVTTPPPSGIGDPESVGTAAPPSTDPSTGSSVAADAPVAGPPAGAAALPASQVEAVRLAPGTPAVVWTRGARVVGLYGRAGGCTDVSAELTAEDAATVAITVLTVRSAEQACTREVRYPPLEVALGTDLGPRRVVLTGADG